MKDLITALFLILSLNLLGQGIAESSSPASKLYDLTLKNKFQSADSLIKANDASHTRDIKFQLAVINFYWWKFLSDGNNPQFITLIDQRIKRIELMTGEKRNSLEQSEAFVLISSVAFDARVHLANDSYGKAIKLLTKYKSLIKCSAGKEEEYPPFYLTSGLFTYTYAHARSKIPLLPVFSNNDPEIEKARGLLFLKRASLIHDPMIRTEALYFLMKIYTEVEPDLPNAERYCKMLTTLYPDNLLFKYFKIKISAGAGRKNEANELLTDFGYTLMKNHQLNDSERRYYRELVQGVFKSK